MAISSVSDFVNNIKASDIVSGLARGTFTTNGKLAQNVLDSKGQIQQTERLFSTRARYADTKLVESRGQWAYIKLDTSKKQYDEYLSGKTSRDVSFNELMGKNSEVVGMADVDGKKKSGYDKFLITGVSCAMSEKVQISEVFGDNEVVYYFGRQPLIFNISGLLVDSLDNSWFEKWLKMYSDFLRGTQTARNYELLTLVLPNMILSGTISAFNFSQDSARDVDVPFSIQFIAKTITPRPAVADSAISSNLTNTIDFSKAAKFNSQKSINSLKGQIASLTNVIKNPLSSLKDKASALTSIGSGLSEVYSLASAGSKLTSTIEGWSSGANSTFSNIKNSSMFQTITSTLTGIRTNLFSPIYGVLSSLTKLVSNVANGATRLFLSLITPVRNILRDITSIARKVQSLVNLVESSIKGFGRTVSGELKGVKADYKTALKELGKAAGAVASSPRTVSHALATMFSHGVLTTSAPFLKSSTKLTFNRPYLSSISGSGLVSTNKAALLKGVIPYTALPASL